MAEPEQRHRDAAKAVLSMIKKERAMVLSGFAESAVAIALADAEQRGAESAKAEAQPAGTGWVSLLAEGLRERLDDIRGASDYDHGKKFAFGAALAMLNKLAPHRSATDDQA